MPPMRLPPLPLPKRIEVGTVPPPPSLPSLVEHVARWAAQGWLMLRAVALPRLLMLLMQPMPALPLERVEAVAG